MSPLNPLSLKWISAHLANHPYNQRWVTRHILLGDDGATIARAIVKHRATAVSDGSLMMGIGTAAFIITTSIDSQPIIGAHTVPGSIEVVTLTVASYQVYMVLCTPLTA